MKLAPALGLAVAVVVAVASLIMISGLASIEGSLGTLTTHISDTPTRIVYSKDTAMITGTLSKTLPDGTLVTMDYTWDGTAEDWRRIWALWEIICANSGAGGTSATVNKEKD